MEAAAAGTRFARLSPLQAGCILAGAAGLLAWCLAAALVPPPPAAGSGAAGGEDLRLYRRIAERVGEGESYHDAAGGELRRRGYPTGSVFNWRPPTYAWVLGRLGPAAGQVVLGLLALLAMLLACETERREGNRIGAALLVLLLVGVFSWCIDGDAFFAQELWAAVLLTLSVCASALGYRPLGLAAGLSALLFRELALPAVVVAAVVAGRERRWREVLLWIVSLVLWACFMAWHARAVLGRITSTDRIEDGWLQFGGASFVLATVPMNAFLFHLPRWTAALYLVLALVGLAGWRGIVGTRIGLTAAAYVACFALVGKPMNNYWGLLAAPFLAFGLVHAPIALRDLLRALRPARMTSGLVSSAALAREPRASAGLPHD